MDILFYLQGSTEPFGDQDGIHFWRLGSSVTAVCPSLKMHWSPQFLAGSILLKPGRKVSLIIPQCRIFPPVDGGGDAGHQTMLS